MRDEVAGDKKKGDTPESNLKVKSREREKDFLRHFKTMRDLRNAAKRLNRSLINYDRASMGI